MILALLLLAGITVRPSSPAVGDLVTIDFPAPVAIETTPEYEVVSRQGSRVVVRTFNPKPFDVRGTMNGQPVHVRVPVRSVLLPNDPMTPAPLAPPRRVPFPVAPFVAIGIAAMCAAGAWTFVYVRSRKKREAPVLPQQSAEERFRAAVAALQGMRSWGRLADATRHYLAATRPHMSADLTTSELALRLAGTESFVVQILRQGDVEKFSQRPPDLQDFDEAARRALELVS